MTSPVGGYDTQSAGSLNKFDPKQIGSPDPQVINDFHQRDDVDRDDLAHHHTLGNNDTQAARGNHFHAILMYSGSGSPNGVVTASVGSLYISTGGGAATTLYVKESGIGNTGWVAK